ncbi:leucine-rich repeat domain-containing protein [Rubripirellula reticaptiva]|uniref:Leucine Rich repeats (2 copies) n=1 Tax=Rubripirellula reticaptiva TaxID=2528013 RepID=A0A5C6EV24_9BACT|nr:hypothetical protein [Rubripirellula reticaptiva]TWU51486.1 hypothetical protein Poly59_30780 [Rubripirellula reticaptiva]
MPTLDWHRPGEFEPQPEDARAVESLSEIKCGFQLNPRGFVFGVRGGHRLSDAHVDDLLTLPFLMSLVLFRFSHHESLFSDGGFKRLCQHPRFRAYMDQNNPRITDDVTRHLVAFPHVRWVIVPFCNLTDAAIPRLAETNHLFSLSLIGNQISDESVPHMRRMTELRRLFLRDTEVTEAGFDQLKGSLLKCHTLKWG